jgi:cell shape-determining protein MreC
MSPYSHKRTSFLKRPIVSIIAILLGIFIVWIIARQVVTHQQVPTVYGDVTATAMLSRSALIKKVTELETTLASYQADLTELELLKNENQKLKAELGRSGTIKGILAHVITVPGRTFHDTFVIDAGTDQGITEGQTVYAFDSIALGVISQENKESSIVLLLSAPDRQTAGTVAGSELAVTLIGRGSGEYEVRMPRDIHFDIGEMVAYQSTTPAIIAQIEKIVGDPRDPFQRLLAKTPVNLQALKWVIVK